MSSFINTAKHFNSIENKILFLALGSSLQPFPYSIRDMYPELYSARSYDDRRIQACITEIFGTLRELQVTCVKLQYRHNSRGTLDAEIAAEIAEVKRPTGTVSLTDVALLKALQCMCYQIEIEHLTGLRALTAGESGALFFLKEMIPHLALNIIHDAPDYQAAKWAID